MIIAIDPDINKSGVTILDKGVKSVRVSLLTFPEVVDMLYSMKGSPHPVSIHIEAGWLNTGNWHLKKGDSKVVSAAKGRSVGMNHEVGKKIGEMAEHLGYEVYYVRPLKKIWGKNSKEKISHKELNEQLKKKGYPTLASTSQDARDSCLIAITR